MLTNPSNYLLDEIQLSKWEITKHRKTETGKQQNSYFFKLFFLEHRNSADIGSVQKSVASAKRVSRRGCLDVQWIQ